MQVNVNAAFIVTRALMPLLEESDDASVVFTSSGVGRRGRAGWGAYAVSKFALEGLMEVLADETAGTSSRSGQFAESRGDANHDACGCLPGRRP